MVDGYLATPVEQDPLLAPSRRPPAATSEAWRGRIEDAVRDLVRPATVRYRDLLAELLPASRDDDRPGLVHLPGGREIYDRLVLVHTTLPLGAEQVHELGLGAVADLREQLAGVGGRLGFDGFDALREAAARSSEGVSAERALGRRAGSGGSRRGRAAGMVRRAAAAALPRRADVDSPRQGGDAAALLPAHPRRQAARDVLVQRGRDRCRRGMGTGGNGATTKRCPVITCSSSGC